MTLLTPNSNDRNDMSGQIQKIVPSIVHLRTCKHSTSMHTIITSYTYAYDVQYTFDLNSTTCVRISPSTRLVRMSTSTHYGLLHVYVSVLVLVRMSTSTHYGFVTRFVTEDEDGTGALF